MCRVGFSPKVSPSERVLAVIVLSISAAPARLLLATCCCLVEAEEMQGSATTCAFWLLTAALRLHSSLTSLFISMHLAWFCQAEKRLLCNACLHFLLCPSPLSWPSGSRQMRLGWKGDVSGGVLKAGCSGCLGPATRLCSARQDRRRSLPSPPPSTRHFVQLGTWHAF